MSAKEHKGHKVKRSALKCSPSVESVLMEQLGDENRCLNLRNMELITLALNNLTRREMAEASMAQSTERVINLKQALTRAIEERARLESENKALQAIIASARTEFCRDGSDELAAVRMLKALDATQENGLAVAQARAEVCDAAGRLQEMFDVTEESDGGSPFHPVQIDCCRVMMMDPLAAACADMAEGLKRLRLLEGENDSPTKHTNGHELGESD